jgi:hypothetical protein
MDNKKSIKCFLKQNDSSSISAPKLELLLSCEWITAIFIYMSSLERILKHVSTTYVH